MSTTRGHLVTIAIAVAVAGGFLGALLLSGGSQPSLGGRSYRVSLLAPTAVSVVPGSEVRIAGLQVGRVSAVRLQGRRAVIQLAIDDDQAPLPRDTRFDIRLRTLIGETFVELYPGRSAAELPSGGVLPMSQQAHEYVEVEQILDVLKGGTRERARRMLQGLGEGLDGRGRQLNAFLDRTSGIVAGLAPLMAVVHKQRANVARLVDQSGALARALADRGSAIRTFARQERVAAQAVASRDDALRATIQALPSTLKQVRRTSLLLGNATGVTAPVVSALAGVIDRLRPSVDRLEPATRRARSAVEELGAASPALSATLGHAEALAGPTQRAMPAVKSVLCQVNPMVDYLAPYVPDVAATFQNLASATSYYDADGHAARVMALVGENNFAGQSEAMRDALKLLFESKLLAPVHSLGYDPYPPPHDAGPPHIGVGQSGPRDYHGTYPRVKAAC